MAGKGTPTTAEVRQWARDKGQHVGHSGALPHEVVEAWNKAHRSRHYEPAHAEHGAAMDGGSS